MALAFAVLQCGRQNSREPSVSVCAPAAGVHHAVVLGGQGSAARYGRAGHDLTDNRLSLTGHGMWFPSAFGRCWPRQTLSAREGAHMDLVTRLQQDLPPLPRWMGITVTAAEPERVVAELTVREDLCTAGDIMHGGAIMAFGDTVGALGTVVNLRAGQGTTTIESKTNFFAGSPVGTRLIAEAMPLHRGRRTQVWETRITNDQGRLVAKVTQTQMVL